MSYDYATLACHVKTDIESNPRVSLKSICHQRQVNRHTVNRALRVAFGLRFSQLKTEVISQRILVALGSDEDRHIKHAALSVGYSSGAALAKRTRKAFGQSPSALRRRNGS